MIRPDQAYYRCLPNKIKQITNLLIILKYFSLGAVHDGIVGALDCSDTDNFLMTASAGKYNTPQSYLKFSSCSISSIKNALFPTVSSEQK